MGGREIWREGNFKGDLGRYPEEDTGLYTAHKTTHNAALAIATMYYDLQNCKRVYKLCIV